MENEEFGMEVPKNMAIAKLGAEGDEIVEQVVNETDPDKLKDLTKLFELNQQKKNIARVNKLNGLLDIVDNEVLTRLEADPASIKDGDLAKYMDTAQKAINNIKSELDQKPLIQINQQNNEINVNSNSSGLNAESRKKILDVVKSILEGVDNGEVIDVDFEEETE